MTPTITPEALADTLRQIADAQYTRRNINGRLPDDVQGALRIAADYLTALPELQVAPAAAGVPEGYVLVPKQFGIPAETWDAAAFAFGGPSTGEDEPFLDCTAWIGEIVGDEGQKTYGLHINCDECPDEGSITLAEFPAYPNQPAAQPQAEQQGAGVVAKAVASLEQSLTFVQDFRADDVRTVLDAIAARQPVCETCNGHGLIGGPSYYAPDEGGVPCPDCNDARQPVGEPVAWQRRISFNGKAWTDWESHEGERSQTVWIAPSSAADTVQPAVAEYRPLYTAPPAAVDLGQFHAVLAEVAAERERQEAKWGQQNHPSLPPDSVARGELWLSSELGALPEEVAKANCEVAFREGRGSYAHIAAEEFSEAVFADDDISRRAELIQVAAVAVAWVEAIDRKADLREKAVRS